ncbi:YciI family protein [Nitrospira moscoviensis]|nr:YciI family protein [Nitrospira moscoviensis]
MSNDYLSRTAFHPHILEVEAMKFMLLCCHEERKWDSMSKSECDAVMEETRAYCEELKKSGHLLAAEQLEPIQSARSVKVRNGKLAVTDGPFAETKEQLGGFFLISARDLDEAIQVASKFPSAQFGTMEVRPVTVAS